MGVPRDDGGKPAAPDEFIDEPEIGLVKARGWIRARIDDFANAHHFSRGLGETPTCGGREHGHAEGGFRILGQRDGSSENIGAELAPVTAFRSAAGEAQFATSRRAEQIEIVETKTFNEADALDQRGVVVDFVLRRGECETLSLGGVKRKTLPARGEWISDDTRGFVRRRLGIEGFEVAVGKVFGKRTGAGARCAAG